MVRHAMPLPSVDLAIRRKLRVRKLVAEHFKELRYNNSMSMVRIYKHKDKWVAEEEGYGYPTLRNFYSKFDDAVDYASSSLKCNYKNSPEVYEEGVVEIG
jgi:hypothetical protein